MNNKFLQKAKGFTLLELMIVLVIVSILVAYGLPSYHDFSMRKTMTNETNNFIADLRYARSEAISRGGVVEVVTTTPKDYKDGWTVQYRISTSPDTYETLRLKTPINSVGTYAMPITTTSGAVVDVVRFNSEGSITSEVITITVENTPKYSGYITINMFPSGLVISSRGL